MTEIYKEEDLAGIAKIDFFLLTELEFPIGLNDHTSHLIVFRPNFDRVVTTADEDSFSDDTKEKEGNQGVLYDISLKYNIVSRTEEMERLLAFYSHKPGVAIVNYNNGYKKIFGTSDEPLFMKFSPSNGSAVVDKAFFLVEIQGVTRRRPVYYKGV